MKLFRVYYSEITEYEEFIEAKSEEEADTMFQNSLEEEMLEPINVELIEYEIEETQDNTANHI